MLLRWAVLRSLVLTQEDADGAVVALDRVSTFAPQEARFSPRAVRDGSVVHRSRAGSVRVMRWVAEEETERPLSDPSLEALSGRLRKRPPRSLLHVARFRL